MLLDHLLSATTLLHVFPQNYAEGRCRFCARTWKDHANFSTNRDARICEYFGNYRRREVVDLVNWIPSSLIMQIQDAYLRLRTSDGRGAYNSSREVMAWNTLASSFRMQVERARGERILGRQPSQVDLFPPTIAGAVGDNASSSSRARNARRQGSQDRSQDSQGVRPGNITDSVREAAAKALPPVQAPVSHKRIVKL